MQEKVNESRPILERIYEKMKEKEKKDRIKVDRLRKELGTCKEKGKEYKELYL